ncbi:hypothetical protein CYLTODRAFT_459295 [Cylindrobasidium torrendii FP15055 ss-10]|uniref:DUF829-domain-containing protein n=1 Tax=Cylindrobasidium torrendii FP15055 ss-10 TaxID=1314674 RepID=A0A0D7AXS9_9AGAR|nr:hypothetical protein CYLTODRAFT_459295 [Cylindrobasidium torrendii FP15055 ss-10]
MRRRGLCLNHRATDPDIIIIFGWLGGSLRHVQRYTRPYEKLYPHATQIIVTNPAKFWWITEAQRRKVLRPAVDLLLTLGCTGSTSESTLPTDQRPRILTHAFSNGGSYSLAMLGSMLSIPATAAKESSEPSALILDSTPGLVTLKQAMTAFGMSIRSSMSIIVAFGVWLRWQFQRKPDPARLKEWLLLPSPLPWLKRDSPRLYVYSKPDTILDWKQVQAHAKTCREQLGYPVEDLVFEDTQHVAHARMHPDEYWEAVDRTWKAALRKDRSL